MSCNKILLSISVWLALIQTSVGYSQDLFNNLNMSMYWIPAHDVANLVDSTTGFAFDCTGSDPYILTYDLGFSSHTYQAILIEMKVSDGTQGQLFWTTDQRPDFSEGNSVRFPLKPDGLVHPYILKFSSNEQWNDTIKRLRLDPSDKQSQIEIHNFKIIKAIGPLIDLVFVQPYQPVQFIKGPASNRLFLNMKFVNNGDQPGTVRVKECKIKTFEGDVIKADRQNESITRIEPDNSGIISQQISLPKYALGHAIVEWEPVDHAPFVKEPEKPLYSIIRLVQPDASKPSLELRGGDFSLQFPYTTSGYGVINVYNHDETKPESIAVIPNLSWIAYRTSNDEIEMFPIFADQVIMDGNSIRFEKQWQDRDRQQWFFSLTIEKLESENGSAFEMNHELKSTNGRLLHFSGPEIFAGEGSFGKLKDSAIFPGIEYLDRPAVSSSDKIAKPPVRDQYVPHPYKNTIPFMSISYDNLLISLLWPARAEWADGELCYNPKFAIPNRFYSQSNHLMGLFVPTVPKYLIENQELANKPFEIKEGKPIKISSILYLSKSDNALPALDAWIDFYSDGEPIDPATAPRSYSEEIALSRKAYLYTCWDNTKNGWGHCAGWEAHPSGGMLALLHLDRFLMPEDDEGRLRDERIEQVYNHIIEDFGSSGLGTSTGCHVMTFEPSFYWGVTETTLPQWINRAHALEKSQNPDGSWGFQPYNEDQKMLGEVGEVVSGTISPNAMYLMRLGRITGQPVAVETGLKALNALNAHSVPRGAQGWECPIAAADIMVSAQAARANLDAYRITNQQIYLDKAVYWAKSGIVFHYLWNLEDRPLQRFATIPIFGTTFFTHSWLGVPVQWCGLVYAYALQELDQFDQMYPWKKIARGIVNSAMIQQMTEGEYIGTLPDSYGDYFVTARGAWINPENIMTNLHALEGNSLNIDTEFPEQIDPSALRVSANADVKETSMRQNQLLFSIESKQGRMTEILIAPVESEPRQIVMNQVFKLDRVEKLFGTTNSWRYLPEYRTILIHIIHNRPVETIRVDLSDMK